jgi:hypothetical protein
VERLVGGRGHKCVVDMAFKKQTEKRRKKKRDEGKREKKSQTQYSRTLIPWIATVGTLSIRLVKKKKNNSIF